MSDSRRHHHSASGGGGNSTVEDHLLPDGLAVDPYDVLGVAFDASDADIKRAYRKKALVLHPDKQKQQQKKQQQQDKQPSMSPEKLAKAFHDLQKARAFLLDAEHAEARAKYRRKLASRHARQKADAARDQTLSESRKRMRQDLREREEHARKKSERDGTATRREDGNDATVEELRRQGRQMQEEYANRRDENDAAAEEELRRQQREAKEKRKVELENRQVRVKWSRKKMDKNASSSPSEHSLAELFKEFGEVEQVEMLGSKGNSALVTFRDEKSCGPCVQRYAESDVMRASYVGKRKDRERQQEEEEEEKTAAAARSQQPDGKSESMEDWTLRRAAEREELIQQMNEEEIGEQSDSDLVRPKDNVPTTKSRGAASGPYPPPMPTQNDDGYAGLVDPLQRLERAEEMLLRELVPNDVIHGLKVANMQQQKLEPLSAGIIS